MSKLIFMRLACVHTVSLFLAPMKRASNQLRPIFTSNVLKLAEASSSVASATSAEAIESTRKLNEGFQNTVRAMLANKQYTVNDFHRENQDMLKLMNDAAGRMGSVRNYFSGKPEEIKDLETLVAQIECMTADERLFSKLSEFTFQRKRAIIERSQGKLNLIQLGDLLRRFDAFWNIHRYVRNRHTRMLPMPKSIDDLQLMMRDDRSATPDSMKPRANRR